MKDWVLFHFNLHRPPSKTYCEAHSGRFSGLRIILLRPEVILDLQAFLPLPILWPFDMLRVSDSGSGRFRPRLQRRGRPRFSRGSLSGFRPPEHGSIFNPSYHND